MTPCPHCNQASVVDEDGQCIHCGEPRDDEWPECEWMLPPCTKQASRRVSVAVRGVVIEDRLLCEDHDDTTHTAMKTLERRESLIISNPSADPARVRTTCPHCGHANHEGACVRKVEHHDGYWNECGCAWPHALR